MVEKDLGFTIQDKRKFSADGTPLENKNGEMGHTESPQPEDSTAPSSTIQKPSEMVEINFETLVLSLGSTATTQLGIVADPVTKKVEVNLPAAKQTIDILEILQDKTRGNLTEAESKLLSNILFELRLVYLEVSKT